MLYFHDKIRINVSIFGTFFFFLIPDQVQVLKDTPFFHDAFFLWNILSLLFHVPTRIHLLRLILSRTFTNNPSLNPQVEVHGQHTPYFPTALCIGLVGHWSHSYKLQPWSGFPTALRTPLRKVFSIAGSLASRTRSDLGVNWQNRQFGQGHNMTSMEIKYLTFGRIFLFCF